MIFHRISLIKLKQSIRWCSNNNKPFEKLLNRKISIEFYNVSCKFITNLAQLTYLRLSYQPNVNEKKNVLIKQDREHFSMIFPPPNVTGEIHLGHAMTATVQDVIIRWNQKQNIRTQWIPGTDHAGIATQVVVEKILFKKYGKNRHEIGREAFLEDVSLTILGQFDVIYLLTLLLLVHFVFLQVWKWKQEKGSSITNGLKKLGTSFDWEKEYFTMDPTLCNAVNEAFIRLFENELIYRDLALINWSCTLESAISDVEVDNLEIHGKTEVAVPNYDNNVQFGIITNIAYKVVGSNEEVIIATTRPETILGDVAVAVHPNDNRYSHLRNAQLWHPFRKEPIPLIFDESADPEFGTGAVKITPAHDKNDFEVGKRHGLNSVQVINEKGFIVDGFEEFSGLPRFIARDKVLHRLAELELYRGSDFHKMVLPICSRSKDIIEFLLRPQWFVKCDEMSKKAVNAVQSGQLKIHPQNFEKEWYRWLNNSRDWCISRQLWWGHQIPAYKITSDDGNETWIAAKSNEEAEKKFKEKNPDVAQMTIVRDQDVLDTWFSSGLLPFSVFNWPETNDDFKKFYPLSLMATGHDILFFWVARMVMLSLELTGQLPFKEVLLHGIICDSYGRKMSKSLGNVISPDHVIYGATPQQLQKETEALVTKGILSESELEKSLDGQKKMFPYGIKECGIDAMRFTLCSQNIKQHFISFDVVEAHTNKKFFNKIFNATRFATGNAENMAVVIKDIKTLDGLKLSDMDRWLLSRLGKTVKTVKSSMDSFNFHLATAALKTFFYGNLCDVYIETIKSNQMKKNEEGLVNCQVLNTCLAVGIDYLEVFAPLLSSEFKKYLAMNCIINPESYIDDKLENQIENLLKVCESIREMKAQCRITYKIPSELKILIRSPDHESFFRKHSDDVRALTFTSDLTMTTNAEEFDQEYFIGISTAGHLCSFGIRTLDTSTGKVDPLVNQKKYTKLETELFSLMKTVSNDGYKQKANPKVQQKHKEKVSLCFQIVINI